MSLPRAGMSVLVVEPDAGTCAAVVLYRRLVCIVHGEACVRLREGRQETV